jgi:hypothetical protein
MKKHIQIVVACLGVTFGLAISGSAQSIAKARIPFSFTAAGKNLPEGDYWISASPHMVKIQDANRRVVVLALANEVSSRSTGEKGRITFHCYRDQCFLSELWFPENENGRQLFRSREEANLAGEGKGQYFAVLWETPGK